MLLSALALILLGHLPELPTSKTEPVSLDISLYLKQNFFAIGLSIVLLVVGAIIFIYGIVVHRYIAKRNSSDISLAVFVLLSALWILTDSYALIVFTDDFGGVFDMKAIVFISYISIMLLPVAFMAFFQSVFQVGRIADVIDGLFLLNLTAFVLLAAFQLPKPFYFVFLIVHHVLIYTLLSIGLIYCIRNLKESGDKRKRWMIRGLISFMLLCGIALISFLLGFSYLYVIIYSVGLAFLIVYMIKIALHNMLTAYKESAKLELYKSMAYMDMLTEIKNHNAFIDEQENLQIDESVCCIILDVNGLKQVNDTLGHRYGDELIRRSAQVIQHSFSSIGHCYRVGGDEFAVICKNVNETEVKNAVSEMENRIAAANAASAPELILACGYAFGGNTLDNLSSLFAAADKAMYLNKEKLKRKTE